MTIVHYYAVLYAKNGNPKQKWVNTGLLERGNKKAATAFLNDILEKYGDCETFDGINFARFNAKEQGELVVAEKFTEAIPIVTAEIQKHTHIEVVAANTPKTLVSEYVWEFIQAKKERSRKLSPSTMAGYTGYIFDHIKAFFDSKPYFMETLTSQDLKDYIAFQRDVNKLSESTIKKQFEILKPALHRAIHRDGLRDHLPKREQDPLFDLDPIRASRPVMNFYNEEKLKRLYEVLANHENRLEYFFAGFYGLRRSEILGINYKDGIDFSSKMIFLKHSVLHLKKQFIIKDLLKTDASESALPMIPEVESMVRERIQRIENNRAIFKDGYCMDYDGFLCVNDLGVMKLPDTVTSQFRKVILKNKLPPLHLHELRHSSASVLVAKNKNLKEVQGWLRHADINTTMNMYTHLDISQKIACARAMSGVFGFNNNLGDLDKIYGTGARAESGLLSAVEQLKNLLKENPDLVNILLNERFKEKGSMEM